MACFEYEIREIVLVFSPADSNWHKAKIVNRTMSKSTVSYQIHYVGWGKEWDEWITDRERIVRGSTNKSRCKQMLEQKRKAHHSAIKQKEDEECEKSNRAKVKLLSLPRRIRECLMSQHKLMNLSESHLISLPKPTNICIRNVCSEFVRLEMNKIQRMNKMNPKQETFYLKQVIDAILYYFNQVIDYLLYSNEKTQKYKLKNNKKELMDWTEVYGVEHLFRLFYHLPKIFANIKQMNELQATKISNYVCLFIGYLEKNISKYVISEFY